MIAEELAAAKEALRISQEKYHKVLHLSPDALTISRVDGVYIEVNEGFVRMSGYSAEEAIGKTSTKLGVWADTRDREQLIEDLNRCGEASNLEVRFRCKDGSELFGLLSARLVNIHGDMCIISSVRDITDRKRMEDELKHISLHDSLTGLYNRAFFEAQAAKIQSIGKSTVGLLVCDVDGLKMINDSLGHGMGDHVLKEVAGILRASFRESDLVARIGGDEFAVLIVSDSNDELMDCRLRIMAGIGWYNAENPTLPISLSVGYAASSHRRVDMHELLKEADTNMYREKLHQKKSAHSAIVQALIKALEARDFLTEGHGDRLETLIQSFAGMLGLAESKIADLRLFAHFHDIGKVGIPDSILFKRGRLNKEEWETMRQHSEIGYRIAMSAPDLEPIADWILKHHEWWNGGGYPQGLQGEEIPLACRILSILDAYDAMTSDRPYRKRLSHHAAVEELKRCAGAQFDPALIESFLSEEALEWQVAETTSGIR